MEKRSLLASLPSVDEVLKTPRGLEWLVSYPKRYVLQAVREGIQQRREAILQGAASDGAIESLFPWIEERLAGLSGFSLRPVINATGIVVHTNLGRSVLSREVLEHVCRIAGGYSTLEYDIEKGKRGKRYVHVQRLLRDITGAEDCLVVNNNAAAVFVCLNSLAKDREVIVSRGELVEIGGSFRIPDVMSSSGAVLKEVGTTNKTHPHDYERAINERTSLLLKVHQSNFRIVGFTQTLTVEELVAIGRKHGLPVMYDLGSGNLVDFRPYGIHIEPAVQEFVGSGADIVTFSGDKLLGGPQGGVIVGKAALIEKIAKNPLMRAVRVDKMTLAAFEATLMYYLDEDKAKRHIPTLRMLLQNPAEIRTKARKIAALLRKTIAPPDGAHVGISVAQDGSQSGGGALSEVEFKTFVVSVKPSHISVNTLEQRLRRQDPPIIARIKEDALLVDVRTVRTEEIPDLVRGLAASLR